jgi:hypothetical protein
MVRFFTLSPALSRAELQVLHEFISRERGARSVIHFNIFAFSQRY